MYSYCLFSSSSEHIVRSYPIAQYVCSICFNCDSFSCFVCSNSVSFPSFIFFNIVWFTCSVCFNTQSLVFAVLLFVVIIANSFIYLIAVLKPSNYLFVSRLKGLDSMSRYSCLIIKFNGRLPASEAEEEDISEWKKMMFEQGCG